MPKAKRHILSADRHTVRLVQQVESSRAGAFQDTVLGRWWSRSPRTGGKQGLSGPGGFVQIENNSILNDAGEFTITLPPTGGDGRDNRDRLYFYANSADPQNPGQTIAYMPGDEWIEVYRGQNELVAVGTPVSDQSTPDQIQLLCRDVVGLLKKTRETSSGFWNNSARDVFEHYTRIWQSVLSDDFLSPSNFPTWSNSVNTSADGLWTYVGVKSVASSLLTMQPRTTGTNPYVRMTGTFADAGLVDHSCWRAEVRLASLSLAGADVAAGGGLGMYLFVGAGQYVVFAIGSAAGAILCQITGYEPGYYVVGTNLTPNVAGLFDSSGHLAPPYVMAMEARERYLYFYLNGQLIAVGNRPYPNPQAHTGGNYQLKITGGISDAASQLTLDYVLVRKTSAPLNGGQPGDYQLASPPSVGGLTGYYYDQTTADMLDASPAATPGQVRVDSGVNFTNLASAIPGWFPSALGNALFAFVRWMGAIYLPLATQDVHFALPAPAGQNTLVLWVGKTRKGESICARGTGLPVVPHQQYPFSIGGGQMDLLDGSILGETIRSSSVGMRSLFGNVSGWYPLIFEFMWAGLTTADSTAFTYDVGGGGSTPTPYVLSPYGCFTGQVPAADSHYDVIKTTLGDPFVIQWKTQPQQLESGNFPGSVIPKVRVGRDTDLVMDETQVEQPSAVTTAEDLSTAVIAQAQGLGGNSSGSLEAEAFSFPLLASHALILEESENLPATSEFAMFALQLETLLALRSNVWQQITANSIGQRQMQDTFPLTGALAEFDWQPGDGLRINLPKVGLVDATPRQIISLKRLLYPDGIGENAASFRSRPRDFQFMMRRFIRQVYSGRRKFQGQLVTAPGTRAVGPANSEAVLPVDTSLVRQAFLIILSKSDASVWTVAINGVATGQVVSVPGTIDVSNYIGRNNAVEPRMLATITPGTGTCEYMLQLLVLVPRI